MGSEGSVEPRRVCGLVELLSDVRLHNPTMYTLESAARPMVPPLDPQSLRFLVKHGRFCHLDMSLAWQLGIAFSSVAQWKDEKVIIWGQGVF